MVISWTDDWSSCAQHCRLCGQVARSLLTRAPRVARSRSGWVEASHGNLAASWHHTHILSPTLARWQNIENWGYYWREWMTFITGPIYKFTCVHNVAECGCCGWTMLTAGRRRSMTWPSPVPTTSPGSSPAAASTSTVTPEMIFWILYQSSLS